MELKKIEKSRSEGTSVTSGETKKSLSIVTIN